VASVMKYREIECLEARQVLFSMGFMVTYPLSGNA
jgi:hypothetical protein